MANTYKLTPADRRDIALRALASKSSLQNGYKKTAPTGYQTAQSAPSVNTAEDTEKENANGFIRTLSTIGDFFSNVATGVVKGVEGLGDLLITGVGAVGGLFSDDFQDFVKDIVAYDFAGEVMGKPLQEIFQYSYLEDGGIVEQIAGGVGQMLPAVAVSVLTAGTATPAMIASMGGYGALTMGASAAGNATEEAFNDGAGFYQGMGYGLTSGATEMVAEKFGGFIPGGGLSASGKALAGTTIGEATKKGVGKLAKNFVDEGLEEVFSDAVNPALKSIYKGKEAFSEYTDPEFYKQLPETFVVGGTVGSVMTPAQNLVMSKKKSVKQMGGSKALKANEAMSYINEVAGNFGSNETKNARYAKAIDTSLDTMSENMKKMTDDQRKNYLKSIERTPMRLAFDEAGNKIAVPVDSSVSFDAMSGSVRAVGGNVKYAVTKNKVSESAKTTKETIERISNNNVSVVVTDELASGQNASFDPDSGIFYVNNNGTFTKDFTERMTAIHEVMHSAEGTKEYNDTVKALQEFLNASPETAKSVMQGADNTAEQYYNKNASKTENDYVISTEINADVMGKLLGSEEYVSRLALRNEGLVKKLYGYFTTAHDKATSKEARRALKKICDTFGKAIDKSVGGVKLSSIREKEKEELLAAKEEYLSLPESERAAWLEENGYTAEDFNDDVLEYSDETKNTVTSINQENMQVTGDEIIDLSNNSELSQKINGLRGAQKYKAIQNFILNILGNRTVKLTDGKKAIVDNRDALHIANKSGTEKASQIAQIKRIVETAELYAEDTNVEHNKFDYFCYYRAVVRYGKETFPIYLNVGRAINDGKYHIYDITKKIKDTANRINGLERPKPNEGYALENDVSIDSISENGEKSNSFSKKTLENSSERANNGENSNMRSSYSKVDNVGENGTDSAVEDAQNELMGSAKFKKERIGMADFVNRDSSVWRNVAYENDAEKSKIMQDTHAAMIEEGAVVTVPYEVLETVSQSFPDLRGVKKKERTPLLKEAMSKLKNNIRKFLDGFKNKSFEFEVNGKILEAKLYNTGVNEVLEKITQSKADMLYATEQIFQNARYLYSTPDYNGDPNVYRWNYFYTPVKIGEETVGVRIAVRDTANPAESQVYNWGIKKDATLGGVGRDFENRISHGASSDASTNRIHQNEPIVKPDEQENSGKPQFSRKAATFTHRDVNEMLSTVRNEALTFTLEDGTEIKGEIPRRDGWDIDKWLYDTLNTANLKDKRALARQIADQILDVAITEGEQPLKETIGEDASNLVREDLALSVAAVLGDKQAQIENKRKNAHFDAMRKIAEDMRDVEKGRFYSATIYDGDTLRAIPNMLRAALKTSRAFTGSIRNTLAKVKDWYCAEDNAMMYKPLPGEHNEGMTNGQVVFDKDIAAMLEELTSGTGALSVQELEMVVDIAKHFQKLSERYQKVFIDGKWVDAERMAEEFVSIMQTAQKEQNWIVRGLLNKYMRQFGDPAALFRAMDTYNPKGFYTKMHEWMRIADISIRLDELHALKEYYEWHEKHKKWAKHLEKDLIEFRGEKMTVGQLMTLYCESKTEKSKQGLADNGFKFTDKDGVSHRIKGLLYEQAKGANASKKHDRTDVQRACKQLENEIWNMLSKDQRAYIKLLENVLNTTCRKWKIDTDTLMKGFSRVHERGYYFPSAHNGIAKTVDTTFYEGDRVGHLSLNKEAVEGARGELLIDNIDSVVLRHVRNMSLYKNYAIVAENRSMLQNIDVGRVDGKGERIKNVHQAVTIRTTNEEYGKHRGTDIMKLLDKMSNDLQGGKRAGQDEQSFLKDLVEEIRGNYARFQLGLNPKTLATQLSSLIAAGNMLEYNCIVRGIKGFASKKTAQLVDKYCPLAELRNFDNSAALAAGVLEKTGKVGDVLMKGIGFVDRRVVCSLFYACQLQVKKDSKLALGSEENLKAAGELLTRVILETQQNSLVTEKSDAMRGGIFSRTFTMFTADGMKTAGRWFDSIGEWWVVSKRYRTATSEADKAHWKKELKRVRGQFVRSTSALAAQAVYMALISYLFRLLYDKDEDEVGENVEQGVVDFFGGLLGGLPIFRDIYSFFSEGYELDNFFLSTVNDVLLATSNAAGVASDAISGKDVSRQDVASAVRKVVYSSGQVLGIPVRNAYNVVTGLTRRIVPTAGYTVDSLFTTKAYSSDLQKAIEADDEDMIATITGLMLDENIGGIEDSASRKALDSLVEKGHKVIPSSAPQKLVIDGEEKALTSAQRKSFERVYSISNEALARLVRMSQFSSAEDKVKAKAVNFIYDVYYDLALQEIIGEELNDKDVLFAEALDIEKLAIIISMARSITADTDKNGKTVSGSKKAKVQQLVNSLQLSAAEKYMIMGYLGYTNVKGESQVKSYINRLNLTKAEKQKLFEYSGYSS